jgi:hypothetical protein
MPHLAEEVNAPDQINAVRKSLVYAQFAWLSLSASVVYGVVIPRFGT